MQYRIRRNAPPLLVLALALALVSSPASALTVALSNDDGWSAGGIQAMKRALVAAGHTVVLAAPAGEQSGSSAVIDTPDAPPAPFTIFATKQRDVTDQGAFEFSVERAGDPDGAEPATSAMIAVGIVQQSFGGPPDLVLMGINDGANIGALTQISGTVGGTIHAISTFAGNQVPGIAVSTNVPDGVDPDTHFDQVAAFVVDFIEHLESKPGPLNQADGLLFDGVGLNINYPPLAPEEVQGVRLSVQGRVSVVSQLPFPFSLQYGCFGACLAVPVGATVPAGIVGIDPIVEPDVKRSDVDDFQDGFITVVPIEPDYTAQKNVWNKFNAVIKQFDLD